MVLWRSELTLTGADIWAAFCRKAVTLIPPEKWFDCGEELLAHQNLHPDQHSHILLWLFATVVNFLALRNGYDGTKRRLEWQKLLDNLGKWTELGSSMTRPVVEVETFGAQPSETTDQSPFPTIIYSTHSSSMSLSSS